jgi:hypothetical protein
MISSMVVKRVSPTPPGHRRKPLRGRPAIHDDKWSKVSVVLFDRQIVRLDDVVNAIRRRTGAALTRASLIRALIDGVLDSEFDLLTISSEGDLRQQLAKRLRTKPRRA